MAVFAFTSFGWIFFVSKSLGDAVYVISNLFTGITSPIEYLMNGLLDISITAAEVACLAVSVGVLFAYDYLSLKRDVIAGLSSHNQIVRWVIYSLFLVWLIMNVPVNHASEFIYFQF